VNANGNLKGAAYQNFFSHSFSRAFLFRTRETLKRGTAEIVETNPVAINRN